MGAPKAVPTTPAPAEDADPIRQALDAPRLSVADLAERVGVPRATLAAYINGTRRPPAPVARRLAAVLRQHATELSALASAVEDVT